MFASRNSKLITRKSVELDTVIKSSSSIDISLGNLDLRSQNNAQNANKKK